MKRIVFLLMAVAALYAGVFAQSDRASRPRVAPTATPAPTPSDDVIPDNGNSGSGGPPVLQRRGTSPSVQGQPTPTPNKTVGDDEVVRIETNLVTMPVSVLDREGRFVSGLRQQDFRIFENGAEQKIGLFQTVE